MYEEYKEKGIRPSTIVKDLRDFKITDDEAVRRIEYCISEAIKNEAPMGKEELKKIKNYIADLLFDRYDVQRRGNADTINDSLKDALKKLGQGCDFSKIPRKFYNELEDILYRIV